MPRKKVNLENDIEEKLKYIGLDIEKIPATIKNVEPLEFSIPKFYKENQNRQYKYIDIKDIQILLTPTNRMDDLSEKYKKASPLIEYLDNKKEENIEKHTTFLKMLKQVSIEDIEKIELEQNNLNKQIPFKIKYEGNYLWQIYYSENTNQYFMLVPTEDSDYSTFFYLLKKQLQKRFSGKIFVPIRNLEYSRKYFKKSEFEDIENYLWLFTKDWPLIYEVYDKEDNLSIQIVGETQIYNKIKSTYKIVLDSEKKAKQFYKLLKAMFILQTEAPYFFEFKTDITKSGQLTFYQENHHIKYEILPNWINHQYKIFKIKNKDLSKAIKGSNLKLQKLKEIAVEQEIEYLAKEKQISTFLECKKTFLGKFKYFFKYSKKKNKKIENKKEKNIEVEVVQKNQKTETKKKIVKKEFYTIEELLEICKICEEKEIKLKDLMMDINALKLKNKNMKKKIENATLFIEEIDSHKKSIFEFWKYSNKDEVAALAEGEAEETTIIKKVEKIFDYEEDLENFGIIMDKVQREKMSKQELDSVFIATTQIIEDLNKMKNNQISPKEIENSLKEIKRQAIDEKILLEEDFDIFGGMSQDKSKTLELGSKKHRELPKDRFNILDINKNTKPIGYKLTLEQIIQNIKNALEKVVITEDIPVYLITDNKELQENNFNIFNINPENEIASLNKKDIENIYLVKLNLKRGTNAISFTNSVFYDNQNKTLPLGQDTSTQLLVDISNLKIELNKEKVFHIIEFENNKDDFSDIKIKEINVIEYNTYK